MWLASAACDWHLVAGAISLAAFRLRATSIEPGGGLSDFTFSDELLRGFRESADEPRPLVELVVPRKPIHDDLSALPADAVFVATRGTAAHLERLATGTRIEAVWASPVTPALLRILARLPRLRAVYLYNAGKIDLAPLGELTSVEHLLIAWAKQLSDVSWLERLPDLRTLYLEDMKRLDLETLPALPMLQALQIGGTTWSTLEASSLEPLTRLPALQYLALSNVRSLDGSLAPLHALTRLRELHLPNFFAVEECARLAAALPGTSGRILTPFYTEPKTNANGSYAFPCKQCGGPRLMLTGRPASILCPTCDAARIAKRVVRWETARAGFA